MSNNSREYVVTSAEHALQLLKTLAERGSLRVAEAAEVLGVVPSTAHRLLATLKAMGFALQEHRGSPYTIGPELAEIGLVAFGGVDVRAAARPILEEVHQSLQETINLMVLKGNEVHFLESLEGSKSVRVASRVGLVLPAHCSSGGKTILARLGAEELARRYPNHILSARTPNTITSWEAFEAELDSIRRLGYGLNLEEGDAGISAAAVCISDNRGRPLAAIAVAAPSFRLNRQEVTTKILPELLNAARRIEAKLREDRRQYTSTHVVTDTSDPPDVSREA